MKLTRAVLSVLLIAAAAGPAVFPAQAWADPVRLEKLQRMFLLNEMAYGYVTHCTPPKQTFTGRPNFLPNMQQVALSYAEELATEKKIAIEAAGNEMMRQRAEAEKQMDQMYKNPKYCQTEAAQAGLSHFNAFGAMATDTLKDYLADIQNK